MVVSSRAVTVQPVQVPPLAATRTAYPLCACELRFWARPFAPGSPRRLSSWSTRRRYTVPLAEALVRTSVGVDWVRDHRAASWASANGLAMSIHWWYMLSPLSGWVAAPTAGMVYVPDEGPAGASTDFTVGALSPGSLVGSKGLLALYRLYAMIGHCRALLGPLQGAVPWLPPPLQPLPVSGKSLSSSW